MPNISIEAMIDDLLRKLEDMEKADELSTLHQLESEATILRADIDIQLRHISTTVTLLKKTTKALNITVAAAEDFTGRRMNAESVWGQYWGIVRQCDAAVFEMEFIKS